MATAQAAEPVRTLDAENGERGTRGADRVLAAVALVGLGALFASTLIRSLSPLADPDLWWHLRVGEELWGSWQISAPEGLSDFATESWVARDWLPQMTASWMGEHFGLAGVGWLVGLGYLACVLALWFSARVQASPLPSLLATTLGLCGLSMSLTPRPQLVSFALLAVFVGAWLRTAEDRRPRWYLVPLTGLWACCHGMWISGVIVGFAVVVGVLVERRNVDRELMRLLSIPVLGVLVAMATPAGPGVVMAAVRQNETRQFISEWQATSFSSPAPLAVGLGIALIVVTAVRRGGTPWPQILLIGLAAGWTVMSMRTVALGAVLMTPLLAASMTTWIQRLPSRLVRREALTVFGMAAGVVLVLTAFIPERTGETERLPSGLDARLSALPAGAVVLNSYELGGWLEWRYPRLNPVIDGNTPAYKADYVAEYMSATRELGPGWYAFIEKTGAEYALTHDESLISEALRLKGWREVDSDANFVLFRAPRT